MLRRIVAVLAVLAGLGVGIAGYSLWQAGRQLGRLPAAIAPPAETRAPAAGAPAEPRVAARLPERAPAAPTTIETTRDANEPVERRWRPPVDEAPDDRTALEAMLRDPDPEIRREANALIELLDAEASLEP
jgi:hypothetical protein